MDRLPDLTNAYALMSPWARSKLLSQAKRYAEAWPDKSRRPKLSLILNPIVQFAPDLIDGDVDKLPLRLIRKAIN